MSFQHQREASARSLVSSLHRCLSSRIFCQGNLAYLILVPVLVVAVILDGCGQQRQDQPPQVTGDSRGDRSPRATASAEYATSGTDSFYDLSADEVRGGHTLSKHVGRSDDELRQRLEREGNISAASTWTDRSSAEETVGEALRAERQRIHNWERRGDRRPNLALHYDARRVIGRTLLRDTDRPLASTQALIVLKAEGPGFYVLTTYPEVRE
jgi:hypothetical protein